MTQVFMTTQEVAEFLGIEESTVRYAASAGWLKPLRQGRRNLYAQDQVVRYKHTVAQRYERKRAAQDLLVRFPTKPPETDGPPNVGTFTRRDWEIFVAYGSDPQASLATVSRQFGFTRQYAQARIARVIRILMELRDADA